MQTSGKDEELPQETHQDFPECRLTLWKGSVNGRKERGVAAGNSSGRRSVGAPSRTPGDGTAQAGHRMAGGAGGCLRGECGRQQCHFGVCVGHPGVINGAPTVFGEAAMECRGDTCVARMSAACANQVTAMRGGVRGDTGRLTGNPGRLTEILKSLTELTGRLTGKTISQPRQTGSRFRPPDS